MADNTILNTGSGGDTLATDDIGGVKYPRSKIVIGADGTNDGDVSATNPLPVTLASVPSHDVTNAGTFATQIDGDALASLQMLDNVVSTDDGAFTAGSSSGIPFMGLVTTDAVDAGDVGVVAMLANRQLKVTLYDSGGIEASIGGGTQYDEDTAHVSGDKLTMAGAVRSDSLAALAGNGDRTVLQVSARGGLWVAVDETVAATQSGTWNVGTVSTLTGSGVAHDGADSGNPHKIGAKATTSLAGLTLVSNADRTDLFAGVDGVQITRPHCNLEDIVTATPVAITDGSSTSVIAAQGAGIKVYVVEVIIANSSASNVTVDLRDGTGGAVKATFPVPANGGVVKTLTTPLPFSANTAVAADPSAAASTITVTLIGFKSKV